MKIPFTLDAWLKDKSQKVETRNGRIVHNIWPIKEPIIANGKRAEVCALIDGEEDALVFFEGGRYLPTTKDTDNPFDLFIITPEPELSEFELALRNAMSDTIVLADEKDDDETSKIADKQAKRYAAELLSIARKELIEEQYTSDPRKTDLYKLGKAEALKEIEQNPESSYAFKRGVEYGKEEAFKDLPRWRKWANGACGNRRGIPIAIAKRGLNGYELVDALGIQGEQYIMLSDLVEKLPGFKEEE